MTLPTKITPCPIIDAIIEIRFNSTMHPSAVFGVIYNAIKNDYPKVEKLPILQVPEPIREKDPSFQFKPYFRAVNDEHIVQIGPDVLTISAFPDYSGWSVFSVEIFKMIDLIRSLDVISKVQRIGIRYINFFDFDIFDEIDLKISFGGSKLESSRTHLRTEVAVTEDFQSTLQVINDFMYKDSKGSAIDIDTFIDKNLDHALDNFEEIIKKGHNGEKELFFKLLKDSFLKTLNPEY